MRGRKEEKLTRDRERLARLQPGGAPDRPIGVSSPTQVDVIAARAPCPLCDTTLHLQQHVASTVKGTRLRVAHLVCSLCGVKRSLYFRLEQPLLH